MLQTERIVCSWKQPAVLEKPEGARGRVAEDKVSEVMGGQTIWGPPGHMKTFGFYSESLQDLKQEDGII